MKDCFRPLYSFLFASVAVASLTLHSCTEVDDMLGMNLLPEDKVMYVGVETVDGIDAYITKSELRRVNRKGGVLIGNHKTERFGQISSSAVLQFTPRAFSDTTNFFGNLPHVDSVYLNLYFSSITGNREVEQKFYIYELERTAGLKKLRPDTVYYNDFDVESYIDRTKPLFSFSLKDEYTGMVTTEKLEITADGQEFLEKLAAYDYNKYYDLQKNKSTTLALRGDSVFRETFHGLYIEPSQNPAEAPEDAAVYSFMFAQTDDYYDRTQYSTIWFYTHSHTGSSMPGTHPTDGICNGKSESGTYDGDIAEYIFDDAAYSSSGMLFPNTSMSLIKRDYSGAIVNTTDLLPLNIHSTPDVSAATPLTEVYVEGVQGVSTFLRFNQDFLNQLDQLKWMTDEDGTRVECSIVINRGILYLYVDDPDNAEYLDNGVSKLGTYFTYKDAITYDDWDSKYNIPAPTYHTPAALFDYRYDLASTSGESASYLGWLNRALGRYEIDISIYLRYLANYPDKIADYMNSDYDISEEKDDMGNLYFDRNGIWLTPAVEYEYSPRGTVLQNPATGPKRMQVNLTYSLVKKK